MSRRSASLFARRIVAASRGAGVRALRVVASAIVAIVCAICCVALGPATAAAQDYLPRGHLGWRTLETTHFRFHFTPELEQWTRDAAARMESVHDAVQLYVGYAPRRMVDVLVDDPYNLSNGFAVSQLDAPTIVLWPVPPDPRSGIGNGRAWAEILTVHEFAHIAHLTRPSRNRKQRLLKETLPASSGAVARKSPRWVKEGYATLVEGRLTGYGRPNAAARAALLRQWAVEGKLPTYSQLDASGGFEFGSYAYLVGSAYLEWLVRQKGDSSLPHLWRRLSARIDRSFPEAFAGVFGGLPNDLYARFTAEVTTDAVTAERELQAQGIVAGRLVQTLSGSTGDPAVSPDGRALALSIRTTGQPSRLVVWRTDEPRRDSVMARVRAELLRRDPEDVPAIDWRPPPKVAVATLPTIDGRGFSDPRWLQDNARLLVTRNEPRADGSVRPDLWLWDYERGVRRRVTHGAGVRWADPHPDMRSAVAVQCMQGTCNLVTVDLTSGAVRTLLSTDELSRRIGIRYESFYRPRYSPDGSRIVVSVKGTPIAPEWSLIVLTPMRDSLAIAGTQCVVDCYDATFLPTGTSVVAVSEGRGKPELVEVPLDGVHWIRRLTRLTGSAVAPEPRRGSNEIYFLSLTSKGYDLRSLALDSVPALSADNYTRDVFARLDTEGPMLPPRLHPLALRDSFPAQPLRASRPYGAGPRRTLLFPLASGGMEGASVGGAIWNVDPVGRLGVLAIGLVGQQAAWRGAALRTTWRGTRPSLEVDAFSAQQRLQPPGGADAPSIPPSLSPLFDSTRFRYTGLSLSTTFAQRMSSSTLQLRAGGTFGSLRLLELRAHPAVDQVTPVLESRSARRALGFAEFSISALRGRGERTLSASFAAHASAGSLGDSAFVRTTGIASIGLRHRASSVRATWFGATVNDRAPAFEQLAVGGVESPLVASSLLSQRIAMPLLPAGYLSGTRVQTLRLDLTFAGLSPYAWAGRAPGDTRWSRAVGIETNVATLPIPYLRVPGLHAIIGVGSALDQPLRHRIRGYVSMSARP